MTTISLKTDHGNEENGYFLTVFKKKKKLYHIILDNFIKTYKLNIYYIWINIPLWLGFNIIYILHNVNIYNMNIN